MTTVFYTADETATEVVAMRAAERFDAGTVVALSGKLGSGKTVFVRGIARALGISSPITSPSFTIVSEYEAAVPLVHVDLYRTGSDEELELLGIEEIFAKQAVVAIEWAEKGASFLPEPHIRVLIEITEDGRQITIEGIDFDDVGDRHSD